MKVQDKPKGINIQKEEKGILVGMSMGLSKPITTY